MKRFLSVLITLMMTFSVIGFTFAETDEPDPEPEFVRPVEIAAVDENGDPVNGVALQLKDADGNVVKSWTADGEQTILLPEGNYTLEGLSAPEGYVVESSAPITVARLAEERGTFYGFWAKNYHENICQNHSHVGLETFWIEDANGQKITTAYCFNHGFANPSGVEYTAYTATKDDLFLYARNKNDNISSEDLYNHVMYILLEGKTVLTNGDFGIADDELLKDYLIYMAIKHYTDPKLFPDGVLQAIINHAKREKMEFPKTYIDAFNALINPGELRDYPDGVLYFYYPKGYDINNESYQILISAKEVPRQDVKIGVHPAAQFRVTLRWKDQDNKDGLRPSPEALIPMLRLYLDGTDVTERYVNGVSVTDNGNETYTIKFTNLPKGKTFSLQIDAIEGYEQSGKSAKDGGTLTLVHMKKLTTLPGGPTPVKPITPPWGKKDR